MARPSDFHPIQKPLAQVCAAPFILQRLTSKRVTSSTVSIISNLSTPVFNFGKEALVGFAALHKFSIYDSVKCSPGPFPSSQRNSVLLAITLASSHPSPRDLMTQPQPACSECPFPGPAPRAYSGNSCRIVWTVSHEALLLLSTSLRTPAKDPAHLLSKTDKLRGLELKFRNSKWGTLDTILLT